MGLLVLVTVRFKVKQSRAKEELHGRGGRDKIKRVNGASGMSSSDNCQVNIC